MASRTQRPTAETGHLHSKNGGPHFGAIHGFKIDQRDH